MGEWWRIEGFPTPAEWQAFWAGVAVIVGAVAAGLAIGQLKAATESRIEQARPYVSIDIRFFGQIYVALEVKNTGLTAASDIRFDWDTNPVALDDNAQDAIDRILVNGQIPFLAPGRVIEFMLNRYVDDEPSDLPRLYRVRITYIGSADGRTWTNDSILDIDQWAGTRAEKDQLEEISERAGRIAAALERISKKP